MAALSFRLFLLTLVFAPLAFGTVEHWSMMTVELLAAVGLALCLGWLLVSGEPWLKVPGLVPFLLICGLMLVQLVPLPVLVLKLVSPASWEVYRPVFEQMDSGGWLPISVHQKATFQEFLRIGSYGLFYILTVQLLRTGQRVRSTLLFVVLVGSVIAFFAILQQFTAHGLVYWFRPAPGGSPGGPWVNINQYASYIEAITPLALSLFLFYRPAVDVQSSLRERIVSFFSSPRSNLHLFLGFGFILLVSSVVVSLCRGGIITLLLSMILFVLLAGYKRWSFNRTTFWVTLCLALLSITWFGWQPVFDEFGKTFNSQGGIADARTTLWADSLQIIKDFPVFGTGFGTFVDIYPSYKTIVGDRVVDHAHNDYIELLTDGGIIGFGLAAWFCAAVLLHSWRMLKKRKDRYAVLTGIGAVTSICALLMHSFVDFNLHNGAVGLYFFFICGLLVAIVNTRYSLFAAETLLAKGKNRQCALLFGAALVFAVLTGIVQFSILVAGSSYHKVRNIYVSSHLGLRMKEQVAGGIEKAMVYDPLEGYYPFRRGNLAVILEGREKALGYYLEAARKAPLEGSFLQRLGMMLPPERAEKAAELMQEGYDRAIDREQLFFNWAEWLLIAGQREKAKQLLRDRFATDISQVVKVIPILEVHEFSREEVAEILPPSVEAWVRYGDYQEQMGDLEDAEYYRNRSLDFIESETEIKPQWFVQLINFYKRVKQPEKALIILRQAVEKNPDYAPFHAWLGDYYRGEGITYLAKEQYEHAVMLEPGNESYRRRLKKLELDIEFK